MLCSEITLVSKNVIFLKNFYKVTPIIFWLLYKKISISELNDEIFYKQPVFTEIWVVSETSTVWAGTSPSFDIFHHSCKNESTQNHIAVGGATGHVHFVSGLRIQDGRHGQNWPSKVKNIWGNVSAKSCSDHIFTNRSDFRTLHLLNKLFCMRFFWKIL